MRNNEKGMSLMAWTVTVIVLVILAFVLVAMVTGLGDVVEQKQSANAVTTENEEIIEENTENEDENVDAEETNTENEEENVDTEETNTEAEDENVEETDENDADTNSNETTEE